VGVVADHVQQAIIGEDEILFREPVAPGALDEETLGDLQLFLLV